MDGDAAPEGRERGLVASGLSRISDQNDAVDAFGGSARGRRKIRGDERGARRGVVGSSESAGVASRARQQRDRTGKGGLVESALFESVVFLMGQHLAITAMNGAPPPPMPERVSSWAIYEIFNTNDGQQVFIGITSDGQWKRFCEFFGQQEMAADPKLATNNQRIEARPWLVPKVAEIFKRLLRRMHE